MRRLVNILGTAVVAVFLVAATAGPSLASQAVPNPTTVTSIPYLGAVFFPSSSGALGSLNGRHSCTASVVHSRAHNLVITAAHCVYGTGSTIEFVPGFHDGVAPYGVWRVRAVFVDSHWKATRDPQDDFAFMRMAPRAGREIESVVGAHTFHAPTFGAPVRVEGYPAGSGGRPIRCTNTIYATQGYPSFACTGYRGGTSGGPWIQNGNVVGVIGGLHQGGCTPRISFSSPFAARIHTLYSRAIRGGPSDRAPSAAGANAC